MYTQKKIAKIQKATGKLTYLAGIWYQIKPAG